MSDFNITRPEAPKKLYVVARCLPFSSLSIKGEPLVIMNGPLGFLPAFDDLAKLHEQYGDDAPWFELPVVGEGGR